MSIKKKSHCSLDTMNEKFQMRTAFIWCLHVEVNGDVKGWRWLDKQTCPSNPGVTDSQWNLLVRHWHPGKRLHATQCASGFILGKTTCLSQSGECCYFLFISRENIGCFSINLPLSQLTLHVSESSAYSGGPGVTISQILYIAYKLLTSFTPCDWC